MDQLQPKNTQEALDCLMALSLKLAKHLKDGPQWHDIPNLMKEFQDDKEFSDLMIKGFAGMSEVPAEIKGMDAMAAASLAISMLPWIQKILNELKQ